jgi:biopolymer transport protein ExbD
VDIFGHINKAGIFSRLNGPRRFKAGLRMAPMIDMIFLLLIFFLVAAKWRPKEDFLPMQLATAGFSIQTAGKPEPLLIQISQGDTGCQVRIGLSYAVDIPAQNPQAGLALLIEKTRQCLHEQKRYATDPVEIICAPDVKWENLARIYNVFVGMGLTDITFQMTEASTDESAM